MTKSLNGAKRFRQAQKKLSFGSPANLELHVDDDCYEAYCAAEAADFRAWTIDD